MIKLKKKFLKRTQNKKWQITKFYIKKQNEKSHFIFCWANTNIEKRRG